MENNCLATICCDDESSACFVSTCDDRARVDSTIAAVGIIRNGSFPDIGDVVTLADGGSILIDACNRADILLKWFREQQMRCDEHGVEYLFMPACLISKGTRPKSTYTYNENGCQYGNKAAIGYTNTSEFMIENYLPNARKFCELMRSQDSFSIAYFFKQGVMVLDSEDGFTLGITNASFDITGDAQDYIRGSFSITEKGYCDPEFYPAASPNNYISELKQKTSFTFGPQVVTGLVAVPCKGKCPAYTIAPNTPFTLEANIEDAATCVEYALYASCSEAVAGITINGLTGVVESTAGLPAGKYKFTVQAKNKCCVDGTDCFTIEVE